MKAMILAAGKGERMLPLTLTTPKPLLKAGDAPLLVHHLRRLAEAGIRDIVINTAHLGQQIHATLGCGQRFGVRIRYSHEGRQGLETAGGLRRALPLLGREPFVLLNADVWTDYPFEKLPSVLTGLAHLVLVRNPDHNLKGDFALRAGQVANDGEQRMTYAGLAVIHPRLLADLPCGSAKLAPLLRVACDQGQVTGELYPGTWDDIGTPQRLADLNERLAQLK